MLTKSLLLALGAARGAVLTAPLACASPGQPMASLHPSVYPGAVDPGAVETLMRSMVDEIRSAQSPEELDWVLSELIVGGPLEGFLAAAVPASSCVAEEDLRVSATSLDRDLQDAVHRSLRSADVALALVGTSRASGLAGLLRGEEEHASLQELLYGKLLPPAVQEAIYAGHVSYLVLLTLLDERPMPRWLRSELRQKLVANQRQYFGLLVAYANAEGIALPDSLASIEPLDLEATEHEAERERHAIDAYLDGRRAERHRS